MSAAVYMTGVSAGRLTFLVGNRTLSFLQESQTGVRKMPEDITRADAGRALDDIELRRRQVVDEIDIPVWYWRGLWRSDGSASASSLSSRIPG